MRVVPARLRLRPFRAPLLRPAPGGRSRRRVARTAVLCLVPGLALCLVLTWTAADLFAPARLDPDYRDRRELLHARLAERPGTRLAVVVGSSRTGVGFVPESLPADHSPLWFNASHYAAGPAFNLLTLNRLLADGFRPDLAVIEVMPPLMTRENPRLVAPNFSARELLFVADYLPADRLAQEWLYARYVKPKNVRRAFRSDDPTILAGACGGHAWIQEFTTPAERQARMAFQRSMYEPPARNLEVRPGADRALRDTLRVCRDRRIAPVLLLPPEGPTFRGWYDPARLARFDAYITALAKAEGVRLIDARSWFPEEAFSDGHHLLLPGGTAFTARLVREAEGEWVSGPGR